MARLVIVAEAVGDLVVSRRIRAYGERATAIEPAFEAVATMMRAAEKELFDTGGSSGGEPWEQLTEETAETKSRKGFPPDILIATEELEQSLTDPSHFEHVEIITPEFLVFGTSDEVGSFHQYGTPGKHDMPARPPLRFREDQLAAFTWAVYTFISKGVADESMFAL